MYVLFIILNETEHLSEVLFKLKQLGIRGATVINSIGAQTIDKVKYHIPFVGHLIKSLDGEAKANRTIFSVIEREEQVDRAIEHIERLLGGDMSKADKGIMFVLPVLNFRGGELYRHIESRENKKILEKEYESEYY